MTRSIHLIACFLVLVGLVAVNCSPIDSSTLQSRGGTAVVGYMYIKETNPHLESLLKDKASCQLPVAAEGSFSPPIHATPHHATPPVDHKDQKDSAFYVIIVRASSLSVFSPPNIKKLYVPTENMASMTSSQASFETYANKNEYDYKKTVIFSHSTQYGVRLAIPSEISRELGLSFTVMHFAIFQALPTGSTPGVDWSFLKDIGQWPTHLSLGAPGLQDKATDWNTGVDTK